MFASQHIQRNKKHDDAVGYLEGSLGDVEFTEGLGLAKGKE